MRKTKEINDSLLFVILCSIFVIPSIAYIISGKKIINLISSFTFFYTAPTKEITFGKVIGTIFFIGIFIAISIMYCRIIKNHKKEFSTTKKMVSFIIVISLLFFIMLPLTSTDVFYYIGTGWSEAHYGVNPYYTSVDDLMAQSKEASNDTMLLKMKGIWSGQTIVYGPVWPLICKILSTLSFGNLFLGLYVYKLFNLILHLINAYLIYKITNKRKLFVLIYALNPLILFDGLVNVHNEVLLIFFMLLGLFFFLKKKNMPITIICFAFATATKYVAILLIPFIVLYRYRKEKVLKKIIYSCLWAILFISIIVLCYAMYMNNFDFLNGIITQQGKFANSILTFIAIKKFNLATTISKGLMLAFVVIYVILIMKLLFSNKQYTFSMLIRKYNELLVLFMLGIITNFQSWYTLWLLPTLIFDSSKNMKWLLSITILSELANIVYFIAHEYYIYGVIYSFILLTGIIISKRICNNVKIYERE